MLREPELLGVCVAESVCVSLLVVLWLGEEDALGEGENEGDCVSEELSVID